MANHSLFFFAILIVIGNFIWLMCFRRKLRLNWKSALIIAILHDIVGYSAMRLLALVEVGGDFDKAVNMRLFGAIFVLPLLYYFVAKKIGVNIGTVMDIAAICLVIGLICGRLNCLCAGCCVGSRLSFASNISWPLREMELLFYFGFLMLFCKRIHRGRTFGQVYPVFMMAYGGIRFLMEWVRVEYTTRVGLFHLAHIWALISFCAGTSIYLEMLERKRRRKL